MSQSIIVIGMFSRVDPLWAIIANDIHFTTFSNCVVNEGHTMAPHFRSSPERDDIFSTVKFMVTGVRKLSNVAPRQIDRLRHGQQKANGGFYVMSPWDPLQGVTERGSWWSCLLGVLHHCPRPRCGGYCHRHRTLSAHVLTMLLSNTQ